MSYLTVENLSLSFGDKQVLKNVSLSIKKGELVTLLGPSGCGKSTLLRSIAGLEEPGSGKVYLDGEEIQEKRSRDRQIGMVFQHYALFPTMTVFDNVAFGLKVKKMPKSMMTEKVDKVLELVELTDFKSRYVTQLSGGQQQRVALARALVVEPKLLLLDEPLSALDARIRKQLQMQIRHIQKELDITMIFVTHDQEEAMRISDRIHVLSAGELEQVSSPTELYSQPSSQFVAEFIGDYNQINVAYLAGKMATNQHKRYFVRPEVIHVEGQATDIEIPVIFEQKYVLGNIIRYQFKSTHDDMVYVDRLNNGEGGIIEALTTVYIKKEDMIKVPVNA